MRQTEQISREIGNRITKYNSYTRSRASLDEPIKTVERNRQHEEARTEAQVCPTKVVPSSHKQRWVSERQVTPLQSTKSCIYGMQEMFWMCQSKSLQTKTLVVHSTLIRRGSVSVTSMLKNLGFQGQIICLKINLLPGLWLTQNYRCRKKTFDDPKPGLRAKTIKLTCLYWLG